MTQKMKILILTLDAGFGHRRAANAIAEALKKAYGGNIDCKVVNPLKEVGMSSIIQKSQACYDDTSRDHRAVYHAAYNTINHYPISLVADGIITPFLFRETMDTILDECPDGIISTFPIFSTTVRQILNLLHLHIPFYSVVTDLDNVHRFWFHRGPDKYFIASEQLRYQAIRNGVNQKKVIISGIPVDTRIVEETRERSVIRQHIGWDPDLPTLIAIGSKRVQNLLDKMTSIEECDLPLQLCIVAGGDEALYQAITTKEWKIPVHCYNYVENIPEMLHAADVLITKAGGLITSEGLACGLPMIIIDSISGQETGNVKFLLSNNAATIVETNEDLKKTIILWLSDEQKVLRTYAENSKRLGKPEAAFKIAQFMINEIQMNKYKTRNKIVWNGIQSLSQWSIYR